MPLLSLQAVSKYFGGLAAVKNLSFDVAEGAIVSLIGPNGAGKSTVFNVITGVYPATSGTILFDGHSIEGLKPNAVAAAGIARTFQSIRLFAFMTVLENVMVGRHSRMKAKVWDGAFHTPAALREERAVTDAALELLNYVGLTRYADEWARNLP